MFPIIISKCLHSILVSNIYLRFRHARIVEVQENEKKKIVEKTNALLH